MRSYFVHAAVLLTTLGVGLCQPDDDSPPIDATSLRHKVLCGYQGWFRCPSDPAGGGWLHWSRDARKITPQTVTFEMWPEMSEFTAAETFPAPSFTHPDG